MPVNIDLPTELEQELRRRVSDLDRKAKEALAIRLFREGVLNDVALSQMLGLDRFETESLLKQHGVFENTLTLDDLESDYETLRRVVGENSDARCR